MAQTATLSSASSARRRPLLPLAAALLALPLRGLFAAIEWIIREVVARLLTLPVLLVLEARWQVIQTHTAIDRRIKLERALSATLILEANAAAHARHFRQILAAVDTVDRAYALFEPICPESRQAVTVAYEAEMQRLADLAVDQELINRITHHLDRVVDDEEFAA